MTVEDKGQGPRIELRCGDSAALMANLAPQSIDLILTSPPYDNLRRYAAGSAFDFEAVAAECLRVLKPGGVLVWVVGDETRDGSESGTSFRQALHFKGLGLRLHDTMIYGKKNYVPLTHRRYEQAFEFMFVLSKGVPKTFNGLTEPSLHAGKVMPFSTHYLDGNVLARKRCAQKAIKPLKLLGNIWFYGNGGDRRRNAGHPAAFPLQLAIDHILSWTNPGDLALDPFVGSGTTLEACLETGRDGIGMDISPDYIAITRRRIDDARARTPLLTG